MINKDCQQPAICEVKLDRLRVISWAKRRWDVPKQVKGFRVVSDKRVYPQGGTATYERVREWQSLCSKTRVFWQYRPRKGWLKAWRITWVADDQRGIQPTEIMRILKRCKFFHFTLVELALDFKTDSGVDRIFVERHGRFGKSRRRTDRGGPEQLRYGSRKAGKLVRCYHKLQVNAFRVELELHSRLLASRRHPKERNYNFDDVPNTILPYHIRKHVSFLRFDWKGLKRYLIRRFGRQGNCILAEAKVRAHVSSRSATHFLRNKQVNNVHRFMVPLRINQEIDDALTRWKIDLRDEWSRLS